MAWPTMHFATGMITAGALAVGTCAITRRGWRYVPVAMTLGGIWAMAPDLPRIFREDIPGAPLASLFGSKSIEKSLHAWGDLFFFHQQLDAQPKEYALAGFSLIVLMYNLCVLGMIYALRRMDRERFYKRVPRSIIKKLQRQAVANDEFLSDAPNNLVGPEMPAKDPVIYRIRPEARSRAE